MRCASARWCEGFRGSNENLSRRPGTGTGLIVPPPMLRSGWLSLAYQPTVGRNRAIHLYLRFALTLSNESGVATFHAQAYIPTQPAQAIQDTRISHAHEDPGRQEGHFPPARQGAQAGLGKTRFPRIVQALTFCGADTLVRAPHITSDLEF